MEWDLNKGDTHLSLYSTADGAQYSTEDGTLLAFIALKLITDRTASNVARWKELKEKGWDAMTPDEQAEWMGLPIAAAKSGEILNLMNLENVVNNGASATMLGNVITVRTLSEGAFRYVRIILGPAEIFVNQTITISCAGAATDDAAAFRIQAYWLDSGIDYTNIPGSAMYEPGSVTFKCDGNPKGRAYFAIFMHAATNNSRPSGATVQYEKVMVELGATVHEYVSYLPFIPSGAVKGMYGYTDMNRVEAAVQLLAALSTELGYPYSPAVKTDWTRSNIPKLEDMGRYFGNIKGLRNITPVFPATPPAPSTGDRLDYSRANDLEKILLDINQIQTNMKESWCFAGEIVSGEV